MAGLSRLSLCLSTRYQRTYHYPSRSVAPGRDPQIYQMQIVLIHQGESKLVLGISGIGLSEMPVRRRLLKKSFSLCYLD